MTKLLFASSNSNKAKEIEAALPNDYSLVTMKDAGFSLDIPEPFQTLEENAMHKTSTLSKTFFVNCFAEDTGLETEALDGAPGVRTARYAGENASDSQNIEKLLSALKDKQNRRARFKTVIALIIGDREILFTGICEGVIAESPVGVGGFGYDPIFIPDGSDKTFAEMSMEEKNKFSHRKKALSKMVEFLNSGNK